MRDRDGWEVWDERDRRDEYPAGEGSPPRGRGGLMIGLVIGGVFILGAIGVALVFILDDGPPLNPPMVINPPPGGFGPGGFGPPPDTGEEVDLWAPADADTRREIKAALLALGRDLRKPDFHPAGRFAVERLAASAEDAVPTDVGWGSRLILPQPGDEPIDVTSATRTTLKTRRHEWRRLEWAEADIRLTATSTGFNTEARAVVWQKQPFGPPVKTLWTFERNPEGDWVVADWEDVVTGLRGSDEIALNLIQRAEARYDLYAFRQLNGLHAEIQAERFEDARATLTRLYQTRPAGTFADLCDMADAKLQARLYGAGKAATVIDGMAERWVDRPCMLRLRAEIANAVENRPIAIEACERYFRMFGNDPDVRAEHAAALIATDRPEAARPHLAAALADAPDHVLALNSLRKLRGRGDAEAFLRAAVASNRFPDLFPAFAASATADRDWPALIRLAEEFIARRPDDPAGPESLIHALAETGDSTAAVTQFTKYSPQWPDYTQARMRYTIIAPVSRAGTTTDFYAKLPDELRDEYFLLLARDLDLRSSRDWDEDDKGGNAAAEKQLAALLAAHAEHRAGQPAVTLYEAKVLIRGKKWADAEKKLALVKLPANPDDERFVEYDSLAWVARDARLDVCHALKKWDAAFKAVQPAGFALERLANRCESDKQWADLAALLEAYQKRSPDPVDRAYWNGTVLAGRGKHAEAMAELKKVIASEKPPADEYDDRSDRIDSARTKFARSAVKAGKAAEAVAAMEADPYPPVALFAYAVAASGDFKRAIRYLDELLEDEPFFLKGLYTDPDLGPLLATPEFADFRTRHPREVVPPDDE